MEPEEREQKLIQAMDQYGDEIARLCYTYVRNWHTAEDLAQESFLKFFRSLHTFRGEARVRTFLYRIAINTCHDYLASWKYKKVTITNAFHKLLQTERSIEQVVISMDDSEKLVQAIERLAPKYKDVIIIFHFGEMSLEETAAILKLPLNTVKTRLRRARQMLGISLQEGVEPNGSDS
ncbi:MAG: sigma-70 family RNA polymerase sigma factor [Lysinibacillus sp.]